MSAYSFKTNKTSSDGGGTNLTVTVTVTAVTVASLQHTIPRFIPIKSMASCLTTLFNYLVQKITIPSTVVTFSKEYGPKAELSNNIFKRALTPDQI